MGMRQTYDDAANITTEGKVKILETDSSNPVVPDPENPGNEVTPEEPTNPYPGLYGSTMYQTLILVRFKMSRVRLNKKRGSIMCG